ncbi:cucumber peeling cupredoxin-like [Rhodamnia argentea]|uniref:Cucumber peeling cupredoxin-like n=1 Tax=Rhodamnia argentea TaxID=178133 RepID=A0A8B8PL79_9MYRT|nr:cucumber peeling cupredoxin-like [Rhodamnia argentea]
MAVATANLTAIALCLLIAASSSAAAAAGYTNYTVGGNSGWFFNEITNATSANYSAWAASQTFNLGDFLLFNTNTNLTVIQTYNLTTYQACNIDNASGNDTFLYGGGSGQFGKALTVAVPLTLEGPNYFFSDADDGVQCQNGMSFEIDVKHGSGLPPSLNQPPPPPYAEPPGPDAANSPPVTVVDAPGNGGSRGGVNVREAAWGVSLLLATLFF